MTRFTRPLALVVLAVSLFSPAAFAAHTHVPNPSTWTLNLKETDFGGGPGMKSDVQVILIDTEQRLKYREVMVDDTGKTWKTSWDGPQDGTMHPITGMPGAKAGWTTATDMGHMEMPDGTTMDGTFAIAPDKKKLTIKIAGRDKAGHTFNQTLVYDRTK